MRSLITALLIVAAVCPAAPAQTVRQLRDEVAAVQGGRQPDMALVQQVAAAAQMLVLYTKVLEARYGDKATRLFCVPPGTKTDFNTLVGMILQHAGRDNVSPQQTVQETMLAMMIATYPCSE